MVRSVKSIPHLRYYVAGVLCLATALNYMDRQTLSVLAHTIQHELKLSEIDYSYITSAFLFSYTVMYAVSGALVDRFGVRVSYTLSVFGWSIANMLHGLATGTLQLAGLRMLLGVFEPANFPAGVRAIAEWFPMRERALGVGIFNAGAAIGGLVALPVVSFLGATWGWRWAFVVTGGCGFLWLVLWMLFYHAPREHPRLSPDELRHIEEGATEPESAKGVPLRPLLRMKATWGCALARVFTDPISYFLNFWIPKYLQQEQGFSLSELGASAWVPYAGFSAGMLLGGAIPLALVKHGWSVNRARKTTMLLDSCMLVVGFISLLWVKSPALALGVLTALMFGHGAWGNVTIPAEVFPKRAVGTVSGLGGTLGGAAGILSQLAIGRATESIGFGPLFAFCGLLYMLAFAAVHFLAGELGVIRHVPEAQECAAAR
jgi:ACS family hexuronate transporter-like MFS transporter